MSGGEQQMLTVARTLMGNPLLVLLDEPSEGVAPVIVEQMANTILELKKEGLSVLLSEQNIHFAELVSDRVYVLERASCAGRAAWPTSPATSRRSAACCRCNGFAAVAHRRIPLCDQVGFRARRATRLHARHAGR